MKSRIAALLLFTFASTAWAATDTTPVIATESAFTQSLKQGADKEAYRAALGAITMIDTVAALKALPAGARTNSIILLGRTNRGDGGFGVFYWDGSSTNAADDGLVVQATGVTTGRWMRSDVNYLDPAWFGALGDGSHDDTEAIQQAIDIAIGSGRSGIVRLRPGVYRTTVPLTVTGGLILEGSGAIGATDLDPLEWRGTHIQYEGADQALLVNTSPGYVYGLEIRNIRFGAIGQSPKPHGLVLENVSEFTLEHLNFNGNFESGLVLRRVTIGQIRDIKASSNVVAIDAEDSALGGMYATRLSGLNLFQSSTAAVRIAGTAIDCGIKDSWIEYAPKGIWFKVGWQHTALKDFKVQDVSISVGNTNLFPESRSVVIDAGQTNDIGYVLSRVLLDRCTFYNAGATSAVELLFATNNHAITTCYGLEINNVAGWGLTTSLVRSDWQNADITFLGKLEALTGYGDGTALPYRSGSSKPKRLSNEFDHWSMWDGGPLRLPNLAPNTYLEGHFLYSESTHRPIWHDGTAVRYTLAGNSSGEPVFSTYRFSSDVFDAIAAVDPEGLVPAGKGSIVRNTNNGTLWFKASGTGNTGWVQK